MDILKYYFFILTIGYGCCSLISMIPNLPQRSALRALLTEDDVRTEIENIVQKNHVGTSTGPCKRNGGVFIKLNSTRVCVFNVTSMHRTGPTNGGGVNSEEDEVTTENVNILQAEDNENSTKPCMGDGALLDVNGTLLCIVKLSPFPGPGTMNDPIPEWLWIGLALLLVIIVAGLCFCPEASVEVVCLPVHYLLIVILYPVRLIYRCCGAEMPKRNIFMNRLQSVRYAPISPTQSMAYLNAQNPQNYNSVNNSEHD